MISVFDLFSIGIGPSSSHTVGPMRASYAFVNALKQQGLLPGTERVEVECYGSLGQTGKGHGTGKAIILGLAGFEPESVDIEAIPAFLSEVDRSQSLLLAGEQPCQFARVGAIIFNRRKTLASHSNGMTLRAFAGKALLLEQTYYSIGGGFIIEESHFANAK
ncbi:L-serine ammonia-lyase, partial [Aeromonas salmonicida subsp. salmonicida]|nr:L-serine ammonia-lyase [Aeromonas salmonicida subsp. salmonicida]